jgi:hypothetical protein
VNPDDDAIPVVGFHRGVGLHDQQSAERLDEVRRAIDRVFDQHDHIELLGIARSPAWPPEARLFAAAKLQAVYELAAQDREKRPFIDLARVEASVAGLNSQNWRDPWYYASMLDQRLPGVVWVKREEPLLDNT